MLVRSFRFKQLVSPRWPPCTDDAGNKESRLGLSMATQISRSATSSHSYLLRCRRDLHQPPNRWTSLRLRRRASLQRVPRGCFPGRGAQPAVAGGRRWTQPTRGAAGRGCGMAAEAKAKDLKGRWGEAGAAKGFRCWQQFVCIQSPVEEAGESSPLSMPRQRMVDWIEGHPHGADWVSSLRLWPPHRRRRASQRSCQRQVA